MFAVIIVALARSERIATKPASAYRVGVSALMPGFILTVLPYKLI